MTPVAAAIAREAEALGFVLAGAAPLQPSPRADFVRAWLADGRAGEMTWLARRADERIDPRRRFAWARSVIVVGWPYPPPPAPSGDWRADLTGRIAAYAVGRDYHDRVRGRLGTLVQKLGRVLPGARFHRYVDTGPLIERDLAVAAGLGWIGRHTLVLHRSAGSWFLLGTVLTSAALEPHPPPSADHCGTCTRCVIACPTGALENGYTMEPRRCLSYLTIEHRSAIPPALRPALGNWVFGCDLCQEACPWNAPATDDTARDWLQPSLRELVGLDEGAFRTRYNHTAVLRTTRRGLVRNAAVALGNSENRDAVPALRAALDDPEPLVRGHVAWALGRLGGSTARAALDARRRHESDVAVASEIAAALER